MSAHAISILSTIGLELPGISDRGSKVKRRYWMKEADSELRNASGLDDPLGDLGGIVLELLVSDAIGTEKAIHAPRPIERAELALEDEAIKAGQGARDEQDEAL